MEPEQTPDPHLPDDVDNEQGGRDGQEEPVILEPAFRHGVGEADMLHALRFEAHHVVQEDGMVMFVGPDTKGVLIEVGVLEWFGILAIGHAMRPARGKYLRGKKG